MRRRWVVAAVAAATLAAGCATLPDSGPVRVERDSGSSEPQDAPYFRPPGPGKGATPDEVVDGFLTAMQANPLTTSVARSFLSRSAQRGWQPNRRTLIYESVATRGTAEGQRVRLSEVRRLDRRGGWLGGEPGASTDLDLRLVPERGEWRIDNPPDALVVTRDYFESRYERFYLYFYDQTGRVLLPEPVFVPRGEQGATSLVRALLSGPGPALGEIARSALPRRTSLDLSVPVSQEGVADVPLSTEILQLDGTGLTLVADQLAWTLRQLPGIVSLRISVDGTPIPLDEGRTEVPVTVGARYDAAGSGLEPVLWGFRGGRLVDVNRSGDQTVGGPLGTPGFAVRSVAASGGAREAFAVSGNGRVLYVAPTEGAGTPSRVSVPLRGADLGRPTVDMFGGGWVADAGGSAVWLVREGRARRIDLGLREGVRVDAAAISLDGARLALAVRGPRGLSSLRVVDVLRSADGRVTGTGRARSVAVPDASTTVVDVDWQTPTTLAVLTRPTPRTSEVVYVSQDGSPVSTDLEEPATFRGQADALCLSVDPEADPLLHTADDELFSLTSSGQWERTATDVTAASWSR